MWPLLNTLFIVLNMETKAPALKMRGADQHHPPTIGLQMVGVTRTCHPHEEHVFTDLTAYGSGCTGLQWT